MRNRTVMEQATRYSNVTYTGGQHTGQYQQTGLNCMRNRTVMEQATRYNNVTQEVNIQVSINKQV